VISIVLRIIYIMLNSIKMLAVPDRRCFI